MAKETIELELVRELRETNALLRALLTVTVDGYLRDNPSVAAIKGRSIDRILKDSGQLSNVEIATILGKSPQAVGQVLANETKRKASQED